MEGSASSNNILGDSATDSVEISFALAPSTSVKGAMDFTDVDSQVLLSPPGTMHSVGTGELRQWAMEVAHAREIPMDPSSQGGADRTKSWRRRRQDPPTWCLPWVPKSTKQFDALKKPTGLMSVLKRPYGRNVLIHSNERGPGILATADPADGRETNRWDVSQITDVVTDGPSVFLSLPSASFFSSWSFLEVRMADARAAMALVCDLGWECDVHDASPPVLTQGGEAFTFRH